MEIHQTISGTDTVVAANDNWDPIFKATFDEVGAYQPNASSKDAGLLVTLNPGIYTAQVLGVNGSTGHGVAEIFEVP